MTSWLVVAVLAAQIARGAQNPAPAPKPAAATPTDSLAPLTIDGHLALSGDALPVLDAAELRPQLMLDARGVLGSETYRYRVQAIFEALLADRGTTVTGALAAVRDAWFQMAGTRGDVRLGYGRVIWGRLDEIQPSDVINPLDASRFLFDGRSEARLPVAFVRGRWFVRDGFTIEGVFAPIFRRGQFDELEESSSPFNLLKDLRLPVRAALFPDTEISPDVKRVEPAATWSNVSGGARIGTTIGRVDVSGAAYRGFDGFGLISLEFESPSEPFSPALMTLVERYPRFTMISGDFETVIGEWAFRGEAAMFVRKQLSGVTRTGVVDGRAFDGGFGFDRRTGDYRVFGSVILHREWSAEDRLVSKTDLSLVGSIDRQLGRDRYFLRGFAVVNPGDASAFVRGLFVWKVRDDVSIEGSAAAFLGTSDDALGRFADRDFLLARIRFRW
jgi:hypothetical protein